MGARVNNPILRATLSGSALFEPDIMMVDGKPVRAFRITCGICGVLTRVKMASMRGRASGADFGQQDIRVARKFTDAGWGVGETRAKHRCPAHMIHAPPPKEQPMPPTPVKQVHPATSQVVPPPREMKLAERRIIIEKLSDVYKDELTGYLDDWTDQKVAKDLGVPVGWVTTIRDENFGPVNTNPEIDKTIEAAKELVGQLRAISEKVLARAADIETRLIDVQKRVRP